jgi:hypothetical protein
MNNIKAGFATDVEVLRAIVPGIETKLRIGTLLLVQASALRHLGEGPRVFDLGGFLGMAEHLEPSFRKWRWFINDVDGGVILFGHNHQYVAQMIGNLNDAVAMCKCVTAGARGWSAMNRSA